MTDLTMRLARERALSRAADELGVNALARRRNRGHVLVLSYHAVIPDSCAQHPFVSRNMTTASDFRTQMRELRRMFTPISGKQFRAWIHGEPLPPRAVLVTFDDGYANNMRFAAPALLECGVPAMFFVVTGLIGEKSLLWPAELFLRVYSWPHATIPLPAGGATRIHARPECRTGLANNIVELCKRLPSDDVVRYLGCIREASAHPELDDNIQDMFGFMNWDEVRELRSYGFTIGSHSHSHRILSRVAVTGLDQELRGSKMALQRELGEECFGFAYPNGGREDLSPGVVEAVREAEYEFAFTVMGGLCRPNGEPLLCDRVWIPGGIGLSGFRTRASGVYSALRRMTEDGRRLGSALHLRLW